MSSRPRILMDCTAIPANHGGVARYIHGVLSGLDTDEVELHVVAQARDRAAILASAPTATVHTISRGFQSRPLRLVWEQTELPRLARRLGADIVHSPHYTFPVLWRGRHVITLHDATFFSHPELHSRLKRFFFRSWIRRAWSSSDSIVVPSGATASELQRLLGTPGPDVSVAHLGVDLKRFTVPSDERLAAFREAHGLGPDDTWFAFLGTIEPRKNVGSLLDAYISMKTKAGDAPFPRLFIAGARGWDDAVLARLDLLSPDSGVEMLGYVDADELSPLLGGAEAVIYPSLGEGFGLPVVEAMACGGAVITTPHLAIPEVGGDAVIYTEADALEIAAAMRFVLDNPGIVAELRERAITRAREFSWQATARTHVNAFLALAQKHSDA